MQMDEVKAAAQAWLEGGEWRWEPGMLCRSGRVTAVGFDRDRGTVIAFVSAGIVGGQLGMVCASALEAMPQYKPDTDDRATALLLWAQSRGEA